MSPGLHGHGRQCESAGGGSATDWQRTLRCASLSVRCSGELTSIGVSYSRSLSDQRLYSYLVTWWRLIAPRGDIV